MLRKVVEAIYKTKTEFLLGSFSYDVSTTHSWGFRTVISKAFEGNL